MTSARREAARKGSPPRREWRASRRIPIAAAGAAILAAALICFVSFPAVAFAPPPTPDRPDVLLITVDTLRPDALGWVSGKNATPAIDALALAGIRFRSAVAPVPLTLPSHVSLLTGMLPRRHGVRDNGQVVAKNQATLARILATHGYATAAFVSGFPLRRTFGLDAGFDTYDDRLTAGAEGGLERPATETTAAALAWIARAKSPWFVWVHYYDPHEPYAPPRQFLRPGPRGAYDGEVAYVDSAIAQLLHGIPAVAARGRITVLAGDHGESLGEHGEIGHGFFLYDTTVLVPMVFHAPGRLAPREEAAPARLIDVTPTLLDMLGLPPIAGASGQTLVPLFSGKTKEAGRAYLETREPWIAYGWSPLSAMREARWKLVQAPRPELYDLATDPGERENVLARNREKTVALVRELRAVEGAPAANARSSANVEAIGRLRSLGYLGAGSTARAPGRDLADPKDRVELRNKLLDGEVLFRRGAFDGAIAAFAAVRARDPGNRYALLRMGIALVRKGDARAAIEPLEEAVRRDPEQAESRFALADALTRSGELARAAPQWMEAARLQPRRVAAWSNLGTTLGRQGKLREAVEAFSQAVLLDPSNPLLVANLAFAERASGRDREALSHLLKAASLSTPDRFPYPASLGLLLAKSGSPDEALQWLRRSDPREPEFGEAQLERARLEVAGGDLVAARKALSLSLAAQPRLRARAEADPALQRILR
ncbi:MAG: sulfatase-like hydrolase/transferase [Acidobacteriota bacterium]|nr:sulfatase-like hydrolase/transferase [Acidobacteriota bacterium]